jgi:hypothetical protein
MAYRNLYSPFLIPSGGLKLANIAVVAYYVERLKFTD